MSETLFALQLAHLKRLDRAYTDILERLGFESVAIYSGHSDYFFADDHAPAFQAYGHFMHWVGLSDAEHSWVVIEPGQKPRLLLYAPSDFWHLTTTLPDEPWIEAFDITLCQKPTAPTLSKNAAVIGDTARLGEEQRQTLGNVELTPESLITALDELRVTKTDYELACLREANRLAKAGHQAAKASFIGVGAELDIQLAYLGASRQRESRVPYQNIIGLNGHAGVLHYQHYDLTPPKMRHSLLVDAGHRFRGYCADITRTHVGPDAPEIFAALVVALHGLKNELVQCIGPGVEFTALHETMHQRLADILVSFDLYKDSAESALELGVTRAFCPHGLGHLLGLQVHDVAGLKTEDGAPLPAPEKHPALRLTRTLKPGMVVTIEPGLYFIPMLLSPLKEQGRAVNWPLVESLINCGGIRIEDNVLVTESGFENLTP
ncbi:Xaa-Pro dipeptidase [Vreelandella nanhaiensis]|uniref:Xaa-Pro dipeptidase n=1 Tax=Vreelandella nanhaiensis TaxID=1258546 RepID=A0A3S0W3J3_9GAMM|nr:Xaa-Pro dipeptidase [Halomonas nanhaiensis]RUR30592.1 Xaa-Pro dipeptidase [Halomonas nanhaiensis]